MRQLLTLMLLICNLCSGPVWGNTIRRRPRVLRMHASAFSKDGRPTASGTVPRTGIVAADPAILPLGSRIRISGAGAYNGVYTVTDTGGKIVGRRIDVYVPDAARARQFGKKLVKVQVLATGRGKQDARDKEIRAAKARRSRVRRQQSYKRASDSSASPE